MAKRARPLEIEEDDRGILDLFRGALLASGAAITRNPVIVGGGTAFAIALFYVSANAIWYQPGQHSGAFFATRPVAESLAPRAEEDDVTLIKLKRAEDAQPRVLADPAVERVQRMLDGLGLYSGTIDGISGPQTVAAIQVFQAMADLEQTGEIDDTLIAALERRSSNGEAAKPAPVPASRDDQEASNPTTASIGDDNVRRVQAGLRAFGNDQIQIDGLMGPATRSGIREFQSLFGLPVTGEIDDRLMAKMRETGLTN